ncbi:hypothetical protein LZ30DRAFT_566568, partial [Colletotrichum cereale]
MTKHSGWSFIYFWIFLLANLVGVRSKHIIAWILKQYQEVPLVADINVVVGESHPQAPKQTVE